MISLHQRNVKVDRLDLLSKLRANLEVHRAEYNEALDEFYNRLLEDLKLATKKVKNVKSVQELKDFTFNVTFPQNHEQDYLDVIEMLEMSVDTEIQLDAVSFKAFVKNEWPWQDAFRMTKVLYNTVGSSLR